MKPLALVERALSNSSRPGDLVADFFLGTGSTLIAAERTGRRCAGLELDQRMVDVSIARWERFTDERAVLLSRSEDDPSRPAVVMPGREG